MIKTHRTENNVYIFTHLIISTKIIEEPLILYAKPG